MNIGSVSWVVPGTYLENARVLEKHVDFVELLVYTWNNELASMLEAELTGMAALDLFYTVHMPTDTIENCRNAYNFFKEHNFPIRNHTLHPLQGWQDFITGKTDITLENLIERWPAWKHMTLDIGHLMLAADSDFLKQPVLRSIPEVHLHGVRGNKDHCALNKRSLRCLEQSFKDAPHLFNTDELLLNFEIFDLDQLKKSLSLLDTTGIDVFTGFDVNT